MTSSNDRVEYTPDDAQKGAKLLFAVGGLGVGWYLYRTNTIQDVAHAGYSFKPPLRFKTTYLLYATTLAGWFVGGVVGNAIYGKPKRITRQTA